MLCSERRDAILLYVSGCLTDATDAAERAAVCEHLATGCPICAATLIEAQAVLGPLAAHVEPVAPPPGAFDRIAERIRTMPATPAMPLDGLPPMRLAPGSGRTPTETGRTRRRLWPALAAAVAASIAITAGVAHLWTRDARSFWQSPDLVTIKLDSPTQPQASGQVWWDRAHSRGRIVMERAATPAAGREYELWIIPPGGTPKRSESFAVDPATGEASVVFSIPADTHTGSTFAITDEPIGGLDAPTGKVHFAGTLALASPSK